MTHLNNNGNELNDLRLDMMERHRSLEADLMLLRTDGIEAKMNAMSRYAMENKVNHIWVGKEIHDVLIALLEENRSLSTTPACLSLRITNYTRVAQEREKEETRRWPEFTETS